jgi:hypothetical protein
VTESRFWYIDDGRYYYTSFHPVVGLFHFSLFFLLCYFHLIVLSLSWLHLQSTITRTKLTNDKRRAVSNVTNNKKRAVSNLTSDKRRAVGTLGEL